MAFLLDRGMQRENFLAVTEDYRFLHKGWPLEKCWGKGRGGGGGVRILRGSFVHCKVEIFFFPSCICFFFGQNP